MFAGIDAVTGGGSTVGAPTVVGVAEVAETVVDVEVAGSVGAMSAAAIVVVVFSRARVVVAVVAVIAGAVVDVDAGAGVVVALVVWLTKVVESFATLLPPQATNTIIAAKAGINAFDLLI